MNVVYAKYREGVSDAQTIISAIHEAKDAGISCVVIPDNGGEWVIDETVYLPDDIEIIVDNAHLKLADGVFCNMFANENVKTLSHTTQKNITLRGIGNAVLDGGKYNGLSERTSMKNGMPHISKNTTMLFFNVRNLRIENIRVINQRWWGITNIFVTDSVFRNLDFKADLSRFADGVHYPDELPHNYDEVYVKNGDGIDLRVGCNHILIENISGFTEDDSVALTALGAFEKRMGYFIEEADPDIHDVKIRNVSTDSYLCSNVRLLNDNGFKLHHIEIDGVTGRNSSDTYRTVNCVRIGDILYKAIDSRDYKFGDTHHISVKNINSTAERCISLCRGVRDMVIENIAVKGKNAVAIGVPDDSYAEVENCRAENILISGEGASEICRDRMTGDISFDKYCL